MLLCISYTRRDVNRRVMAEGKGVDGGRRRRRKKGKEEKRIMRMGRDEVTEEGRAKCFTAVLDNRYIYSVSDVVFLYLGF